VGWRAGQRPLEKPEKVDSPTRGPADKAYSGRRTLSNNFLSSTFAIFRQEKS